MKMQPQNMRMGEQIDRAGYTPLPGERIASRESQTRVLSDRCTVQSRTLSTDAVGGQTETWTDAYFDVPCRLLGSGNAFGPERVFAGSLIQQADFMLVVTYGQALTVTDRITDVRDADGASRDAGPFEILAVGKTLSGRTATQALLRRLT